MNTDSQELALQKYLPQALQLPALIAGLSLFFGSALLLSKCGYFPGFFVRISFSDIVSEAVVITPLGIAYMIGVSALGIGLRRARNGSRFVKRTSSAGVIIVCLVITFFASKSMYENNYRMVVYWAIPTYIVMSALVIERTLSKPINYKQLSRDVIVLIVSAYVFIAFLGSAYWMTIYRTSDRAIQKLGFQVCFEKCYPGIVLATTSSTVAVRFWRDQRVHYYPQDALKEYVYGRSVVYSDKFTISDLLDEFELQQY